MSYSPDCVARLLPETTPCADDNDVAIVDACEDDAVVVDLDNLHSSTPFVHEKSHSASPK